MDVGLRRTATVAFVAALCVTLAQGAQATGWTVFADPGAPASAQSLSLQPPANVVAQCVAPTTKAVTVSWSDLPGATYTVWQSTTSATSGFTAVASGLGTPTWTSGTLKNASYWYAVTATFSATWQTARSTATSPRTIRPQAPVCS